MVQSPPQNTVSMLPTNLVASASSASLCCHTKLPAKLAFVPYPWASILLQTDLLKLCRVGRRDYTTSIPFLPFTGVGLAGYFWQLGLCNAAESGPAWDLSGRQLSFAGSQVPGPFYLANTLLYYNFGWSYNCRSHFCKVYTLRCCMLSLRCPMFTGFF